MEALTLQHQQNDRSSIAMTVVLISFSMLFATLFLGYALYRSSSTVWPPMGLAQVPLKLPLISTSFILISSFTFWRARSQKLQWVFLTFLLGLGFLISQVIFWKDLKENLSIYPSTGIFGSLLYGLTWIHAAHLILGLAGIMFLLLPYFFKKMQQKSFATFKNVEKFWHFLGVTWLLILVSLFIF